MKNDYIAPLRVEAMQYITGERKIIPIHNVNRVRSLIKNDCCNFSAGKCVFLDDSEEHACPQVSAENVLCEWFRDAILPHDIELQTGIYNGGNKSALATLKRCAVCGKPISSDANKAKYCSKCAKSIKAKQKLAYKHRIRGEK
jgi:hypothetical protein